MVLFFYVTENDHLYLSNRIEREEGGTPDIVGSIRTGMAFHVKQVISVARIEQLEHQLWSHAKSFLINEPNVALLGMSVHTSLSIGIYICSHVERVVSKLQCMDKRSCQ